MTEKWKLAMIVFVVEEEMDLEMIKDIYNAKHHLKKADPFIWKKSENYNEQLNVKSSEIEKGK